MLSRRARRALWLRSNCSRSGVEKSSSCGCSGLVELGPDATLAALRGWSLDVGGFFVGALFEPASEVGGAVAHPGLERPEERVSGATARVLAGVALMASGGFSGRAASRALCVSVSVSRRAKRPSRRKPPAAISSSCRRWPSAPRTTRRAWATTAGSSQGLVGDEPRGDAVEATPAFGRPDLRAQQAQAHLDEPVVEVGEHDVVAAVGDGVVEGDRAGSHRCADGRAPRRSAPSYP